MSEEYALEKQAEMSPNEAEKKTEGLFRRLRIPSFKKASLEGILILLVSALIATLLTLYTYGLDNLISMLLKVLFPET